MRDSHAPFVRMSVYVDACGLDVASYGACEVAGGSREHQHSSDLFLYFW